MCFGPSSAEKRAARTAQEEQARLANEQRLAADNAAREEAERRARQKAEDITSALSASTIRKGMSGGSGRRSLFSSPTAAGFIGRFG
jgi:hypothetical protein